MAITGITFTMYPVTDMARAVSFYRDVLGLKKDGLDNDVWVEFDGGGATFGIGCFEQVGKPGTAQSLALEVPDLPAFITSLAQRGVEASAPHELQNCRISVVSDPDGNRIWLHQRKDSA